MGPIVVRVKEQGAVRVGYVGLNVDGPAKPDRLVEFSVICLFLVHLYRLRKYNNKSIYL